MGGVGGVLHDAVGFAGASCEENVQDGWEIYIYMCVCIMYIILCI